MRKGIGECRAITLTTGQDNIAGTAGNDTITGTFSGAAGGNNTTLTAADIINGGDGKDALLATLEAGSVGVMPVASISGVENFFIRNVSGTNTTNAAPTFNFGAVNGEEQVWNDRSTNTVAVTNLAAGTTVGVKGQNTVVSATDAAYVATATAANIALDGGLAASAAAATGAVTVRGAGLRSATVTSTNGTNNISNLNLAGGETSLTIDAQSNFAINDGVANNGAEGIVGAGLTSITVKGAGSANLGEAAIPAAVATVDASANTGGVTLTLSAANTPVSNGIKFTGGSGNDVVTTNGLGGTLLTTASIDAGAGTADRLVVANTNDILIGGAPLSKAQADLYKGFEQVQVQNGVSVNVDLLATSNTIDAVRINDGAGATGVTNVSATGAQNVTILAANSTAGAITIGVKGATTTGQIDTVKAAVTTTTAAGAAQPIDLTGIVLTGVENLELTGSNGADKSLVGNVTLTTTAATDLSSIKLNNGNVVDTNAANNNSITVAAGQAAINLNIDATGSGDTTVNAAAYNTATGVRITTDAGNDVIQGSARADVIVAGAGDDVIQGDVAAQVLTAGVAQVSTFVVSNAEAGDVIQVGNGTYTWTGVDATDNTGIRTLLAAQINGESSVGSDTNASTTAGSWVVTGNLNGAAFAAPALNATNGTGTGDSVTLTLSGATFDAGELINYTINGGPVVSVNVAGMTLAAAETAVRASLATNLGITVAAAVTPGVITFSGPVGVDLTVVANVETTATTAPTGTDVETALTPAVPSTVTIDTIADFEAAETLTVQIGASTFSTNFATNLATSLGNFVTTHAAAINTLTGGVLTTDGTALVITNAAGTGFTGGAVSALISGGDLGTLVVTPVAGSPEVPVVDNGAVVSDIANDAVAAGATNTQLITVTTVAGTPEVVIGGTLAADTLTGGAGNDIFVILGGAGDNGSTFTTMDTITDLNLGGANQAGRVDVIDLNPGVASTITALVNAGQPLAMNAQATSLSAAVNGLFTAGAALATAANGTAGLFTYNGDTYLIALNGGAVGAFDGNDTIIKVTGVAGTLDISDFI